jgi:20S proteasome alpha/beta subunit
VRLTILSRTRYELSDRDPRENLLGITGKDFTIIAASKAAMRGATILKASDDKTRQLNKHTIMAFSGEAGDTGIYPFCLPVTPSPVPTAD